MSEPGDELTPLPESPDEKPRLSRSPYVALGVAALVVSTVFATVAALASTREDQAAPSPESHDTVESTSDTYTTDPTATSAPASSKGKPSKSSTSTTTTTEDETTTADETTGNVTTPGETTTPRPTTTKPAPPANKTPDAEFTVTCSNLACEFDGGSSSDPDGSIASYSWSFGASGETASHTFDAPGTFDVTLTVKDDKGKSDSVTKPVTVAAPTTTSGN
jgi:PKD repeat protein